MRPRFTSGVFVKKLFKLLKHKLSKIGEKKINFYFKLVNNLLINFN